MALAIDEFDEQLALRIRQLLHPGLVGLHDALFHSFHVFVAGFLVGQRIQIFRRFHHNHVGLLGNRQHSLYVFYKPRIGSLLFLAAEGNRRKDIDVVHFHKQKAVAILQHLSYLDRRNKAWAVIVRLLFLVLCLAVDPKQPADNSQQHSLHGLQEG